MVKGKGKQRIACFLVVAGFLTILVFAGSNAALNLKGFQAPQPSSVPTPEPNKKPNPPQKPSAEEIQRQRWKFWSQFSETSYQSAEPLDPKERANRQKKNRHYDRMGFVAEKPSDTGESTVRVNERVLQMSPLPTEDADIVLIA